jgi:outer membrane PBP1 activator LpoA protein
MLIKSLKGLLAVLALGAGGLAAAAPCDGRLCASMLAITSLQVPAGQAAPVTTAPVDVPPAAAVVPDAPPAPHPKAAPVRIGLMLPLRSETLGPPAEALMAGFMAAWDRERDGFVVNVIETGDTVQQALDAYAGAIATNDIVVGPLARSAVGAVASSPAATKPTIALNTPDSKASVPQQMLVMGLSIEDEARQAANWAHAEHPDAGVLLVSAASSWQRRVASAFAAQIKQLGHTVQLVELPASNGYLSESALNQLKTRTEAERPGMVFAALDADQLRQLRSIVGGEAPYYSASAGNPGSAPGQTVPELDGLRLLDLPWLVQPDHPAVMAYARRSAGLPLQLDLDRLYALGIDAFRVARELAARPKAPFRVDGVTGRLSISFGLGPAHFERQQPTVVYQNGAYKAASAAH